MKEELIFSCVFGSHVYGTNTPASDKDFKRVYLPDAESILLQRVIDNRCVNTKDNTAQKNSKDDIDIELFSLQRFLKMLLDGQTAAITMLFTPKGFWLEEPHPAWYDIQDNRKSFLHSGVSAFAGYCRGQANKYGIKGSRVAAVRNIILLLEKLEKENGHLTKLTKVWEEIEKFGLNTEHCNIISPDMTSNGRNVARMLDVCNRKVQEFITIKEAINIYRHVFDEYGHRALQAEKQENIDWKALMHAVRVASEAKELLLTGFVTYPRPEAQLLLRIRKGEVKYQDVAEIIEVGLSDLDKATQISLLPKSPCYKTADEIIMKWHKKRIIEQ